MHHHVQQEKLSLNGKENISWNKQNRPGDYLLQESGGEEGVEGERRKGRGEQRGTGAGGRMRVCRW